MNWREEWVEHSVLASCEVFITIPLIKLLGKVACTRELVVALAVRRPYFHSVPNFSPSTHSDCSVPSMH